MAAVKILRGPVCSDAAEEVPESKWPVLLDERRRFCTRAFPDDCRQLLFFIEDGHKSAWMGYGGRERYLAAGLGLDPQLVDLAVKGLEISDPSKATGWDRAVVLGGYGGDHGVARKRNEKGSSCQAMSLKPV